MPLVTGKLTDFGLDPMLDNAPRVVFTYTDGADGQPTAGISRASILATHPVAVDPAYNGYIEAELIDTASISPAGYYTVSLEWRDDKTRVIQRDVLPGKLYVPAAGGVLADLLRVPSNPALVWSGKEPPGNPSPGTWWLNESGDLNERNDRGGWTFKQNLRGPAGYMATGAAEDAQALANFTNGTAGPNPFRDALESRYSPVASLVLNAKDFAIYPGDMTKDSTAGVQAAINKMETFGIGTLEWPAMTLLINGTIRIKKPMQIRASYGADGSGYNRKGGAAVVTNGGTAGTFMFDIAPEGFGLGEGDILLPEHGGGRILGFWFEGLFLYGGDQGKGIDRGGIRMGSVHSEVTLKDLKFFNFNRQGLRLNGVYDGTLQGITMSLCGNATYPAMDLENNSNALHIFGLHLESCQFPLRLSNAARHCQFIGGKIEMYTFGPKASPIQILSAYENVFVGMQFVQRNADDDYFYPNGPDDQPAMILIDGVESRTSFDSCMFTTQPYHTKTKANSGSRWIKTLRGTVQIRGGIMDTCWGGSGPRALQLGSRSIVTGLHMRSRSQAGTRNLMEIAADCVIDGCLIDAVDESTAITAGVLITATGENNTWGANNKIRVTVKDYISAAGRQQFHPADNNPVELTPGTAVPDLGWTTRGNSRLFSMWHSSNPPVTWKSHKSDKRFRNDEITIAFYDTLTTIEHGTAWKLRGAVNVTPPNGGNMHFRYDGTAYVELWRNF